MGQNQSISSYGNSFVNILLLVVGSRLECPLTIICKTCLYEVIRRGQSDQGSVIV